MLVTTMSILGAVIFRMGQLRNSFLLVILGIGLEVPVFVRLMTSVLR